MAAEIKRRKSKKIIVRNVPIGGDSPVTVQSMTNSDTADREATTAQIKALEKAGCEIIRFTVNTEKAAENIPYYLEATALPLVADIHFDYRLAIAAARAGISKIRINPGNIGDDKRLGAVIDECAKRDIPVRIGVNGGSLEKGLLEKYGRVTPEAITESVVNSIARVEHFGYKNLVLSVKSSDVGFMIKANRAVAAVTDYPIHLGVTEAGALRMGTIKGAVGIGALLADGIGDTLRVSLSDDITKEVAVGRDILKAVGLRGAVNLISCPTCGRCKTDLISKAKRLEERFAAINTDKNINIALMGCIVNGPGEATEADAGIACGVGEGLLFRKGKPVYKVPEDKIEETLAAEVERLLNE